MTGDFELSGSPQPFDGSASVDLLRQGQTGDRGAVNELLTRYIPRLARILRVKIPPGLRARVEPDDVLQETLIVATRRLDELEVRTSAGLLQWLAKIAEFEIKNRLEYLRAQKRAPDRERALDGGTSSCGRPAAALAAPDPSPSQAMARAEMEQLVDRELQVLEPPDYREVILLRDYYEYDWEQVRAALRRPSAAAVQDLYRRAMTRLRERVGRVIG